MRPRALPGRNGGGAGCTVGSGDGEAVGDDGEFEFVGSVGDGWGAVPLLVQAAKPSAAMPAINHNLIRCSRCEGGLLIPIMSALVVNQDQDRA